MGHRQGQYAGLASRAAALGLDILFLWLVFVLIGAAFTFFAQQVTGNTFDFKAHHVLNDVVLIVWGFVYFAGQWTLGGRTLGMAAFGVQVVTTDGGPVHGGRASVRALLLPVAVSLFVITIFMLLIGRQRRGIHDLGAGTVVVYSWDAKGARLRWLAGQNLPGERSAPPTLGGNGTAPVPGADPGQAAAPGDAPLPDRAAPEPTPAGAAPAAAAPASGSPER
ncbi:MAG TPA: RDD family protein [Acidimicrobiales bacterium]|nr:RDD family protein [Acidimicrobiales bacterium]